MISYEEYVAQEKRIYAKANLTGESDIICARDAEMFPNWEDLVGTSVPAGTVCAHEGVKYLVAQAVTPIESQAPGDEGMLAVYKPYRDGDVYPWLYGEYIEIGWQRSVGDVVYTAIQDPGANIYSPELVPAVWEVTNEHL